MTFGEYKGTCVLGFKTSLSVPDREPRIGHRQLKSGKDFINNQAGNTTKVPVVSACSRILTFKIFVLTSLNIVQWFLKSVALWQLKDHLYCRVPNADFNTGAGTRAFQWARAAHKRHSFNWIVWNGEWIARPKVKRFSSLSSWGVGNDAATSSAALLQAGSSWRGCVAVFMSHRLLIKHWTNSTVFLPLRVGKKILTWFCSSPHSLFCSVRQHWNEAYHLL